MDPAVDIPVSVKFSNTLNAVKILMWYTFISPILLTNYILK